ncbi:hypothetical protein [Flavobacterium sp.]|uniref:hypothetical protein n=1 Tax=Flavobacterium sp. TaxID=239 RepID=UPI002639A75F|nr:hypothetical protein [Flavobacterium sp.]
MADIHCYAIDQQKNRFNYLVQRFLASHVTDHILVILGLTVNSNTCANKSNEKSPLSLTVLTEFIAALMLCTGKKYQWKADDVMTLMGELQRDYDALPPESGILTVEYWEPLIPGICVKADQFLEALFNKANAS